MPPQAAAAIQIPANLDFHAMPQGLAFWIATAREQLMARDWPAGDVIPLVELIADPRHKVSTTETYRLSEEQARAILDLRLQRLTGLERDKIAEELTGVAQEIEGYLELLGDRDKLFALMSKELIEIKEKFATPRRTEILDNEFEEDIEDLIQREDMVVTVSHKGYIKRVPLSAYRAQRRGGKGRAGMATREDDFVSNLFIANTHTPVLFFSSRGIVYKLAALFSIDAFAGGFVVQSLLVLWLFQRFDMSLSAAGVYTAFPAANLGNITLLPLTDLYVGIGSHDRVIKDSSFYNQTDVITHLRDSSSE